MLLYKKMLLMTFGTTLVTRLLQYSLLLVSVPFTLFSNANNCGVLLHWTFICDLTLLKVCNVPFAASNVQLQILN